MRTTRSSWKGETVTSSDSLEHIGELLNEVEADLNLSREKREGFAHLLYAVESRLDSMARLVHELANEAAPPVDSTASNHASVAAIEWSRPLESVLDHLDTILPATDSSAFTAQFKDSLRGLLTPVGDRLDAKLLILQKQREHVRDGRFPDLQRRVSMGVGNLTSLAHETICELRESLTAASAGVRDAISAYQSSVDGLLEDFREAATLAFAEEALERVGDTGEDVLSAYASVEDLAGQKVAEFQERLAQITERLNVIIELIEPAKPVLDSAASIA
jgi:hypothetical protein